MDMIITKFRAIIAACLLASFALVNSAYAAINSAMIWDVRNGGASTNGGGFRGSALFSSPTTPTVTPSGSGGTVAANTYYVVATYSGAGETPISGQQSVTLTGSTSSFTVTSPSAPGVGGPVLWNLYVATASAGPYFPQGTSLTIGSNRVVTTTPPTSGTQPPGVDYSQQTSPQVNVDNSAITATTAGANSNTLTFTAGYTPTGADVGNIFHAASGTNINAGFYEITAITSTTWTVTGSGNLTTASGAGSAIVGKMGGSADHPATISSAGVASNIAFVKYSATAYQFGSSANVSGGRVSSSSISFWQGWDVTRAIDNSDANLPILNANAASITMMSSVSSIANFSFTNTGANASVVGLNIGAGHARNCKFDSMSAGAATASSTSIKFFDCSSSNAIGNTAQFASGASAGIQFIRCVVNPATSGTGDGFSLNAGAACENCVVNGAGGNGITTASGVNNVIRHCTVYNCASNGLNLGDTTLVEWTISYGNGSTGTVYGFARNGAANPLILNCAGGGNHTANTDPNLWGSRTIGFVTLSGNPFNNAGSGDFSLNTVAGAGASCRGIAVGLQGLSTTSYEDIGVSQHPDPVTYFAR